MDPIVEPGGPLTARDRARFSRQTALGAVGEIGQRRLRAASVGVVGAGGLGSPALLYLAAAGVGRIGVIDGDDVETTNLARQVLHSVADVGRRKVASARDALAAIDPDIQVEARDIVLDVGNARDVLRGYDVVLDGSDNVATRYAVNDACADLGIPLVWGAVLGFDAQVSVFWSRPPRGEGVDLRDLFPEPPQTPSCAQTGVLGALCGQAGAVMASEAVKLITGAGEPLLGRVLVLDGLAARSREVPVRRAAPPAAGRIRSGAVSRPDAGAPRLRAPVADRGVLPASRLAERLSSAERLQLLDVREPQEHATGAIPGSRLVPLADLRSGAALAALPDDEPLVLYCATGARSEEAASILRAAGHDDVARLEGGLAAWRAHQSPGHRPGGRARLAP